MAEVRKVGRVIAIPYPSQGHVNPLMHISKLLAKQGIRVTMINTHFIHNQLIKAMGEQSMEEVLGPNIDLISVSDGFPLDENRDNIEKLFVTMMNNLKPKFEELLQSMAAAAADDTDPISCAIVDMSMAWTLEIAEDLGIRGAIFTPFTAAHSVLNFSINELIENGVIDPDGVPVEEKGIVIPGRITPSLSLHTRDLPWRCIPWMSCQSILFKYLLKIQRGCHYAKFCIIIVPPVLEPEVISLNPKLLPLGPLTAADQAGQLWKEDTSCLRWLDQQPAGSVVYMAFGSSSNYSQKQFEEMAMGIQLANRPFLWVARPGTEQQLPDGFNGEIGKIVSWVPQQKVLNHPSVGIFWSHCGWNSVMEGVASGLPFLCCPYVGDHFINMKYVTDIWRVGVGLERDEDGVVSRLEISQKLKQLEGDEGIKARTKVLAEKIKTCWELPHGVSAVNLDRLLRWVKNQED